MNDAKEPIWEISQREHNRKDPAKTLEQPGIQNHELSPASKDDSIHGDVAADTAEPSSERTTSDDLIGFCEKHLVTFWPEKCFICESRARRRSIAELERQIVELTKFAERAATLDQKDTAINKRLSGTKLTVDVLSEWLRQTRKQLTARDRQIAQLQHEIAALKATCIAGAP